MSERLSLADRTRNFWSASFYLRRAPERDPAVAILALKQVASIATGTVQKRAAILLRDFDHGTDEHPTRAG